MRSDRRVGEKKMDTAMSKTPKEKIVRRPLNNAWLARRKRRLQWFAVSVVALVIFGAVLAAAWYQPLTPEMQGYFATRVVTGTNSVARSVLSVAPSSHTVWLEPAGTFTVQVILTVDNNGPFPIKVDDVRSWGKGSHAYFDTYDKNGFSGGKAFKPFIVTGHWQRTVLVNYRQRCATSEHGRVVVVKGLPTTFSFLGFSHTVPESIAPLYIRLRRSC
jgi:hypothetical protein